jgi:cell division transport system permease protein
MIALIRRVFKAGWTNYSRDKGLIAANVFILSLAVLTFTTLFTLKTAGDFLVSSIQDKVDVAVYFKFDATEEDIFKIKDQLVGIPQVKDVQYVSQEEALRVFTERHKHDPVLMQSLEEVGKNPFSASLNIKAFQASQYQAVADFLGNASFASVIDKVDYYQRKPVIEKIFSLINGANTLGVVFSVLIALIASLIVFNTIRMAIYNSREEIKVQRLVGASNWFIRGPFLVQGAVAGFFAFVICFVLFGLICFLVGSRTEFLFPGLNFFEFFNNNFWYLVLIQIISGVGLGIVASLVAVRRYLKV